MNNNNNTQYGVGFIELVLVLPLILALFLGAVEFSRELRVKLKATAVSKQLGDAVFRACWADVRNDTSTPTTTANTCLTSINTAALRVLVDSIVPGAKAILSIWRCESTGGLSTGTNPVFVNPVFVILPTSSTNPATKFNIPTSAATQFAGTVPDSLGGLCSRSSPIITAEVFAPYAPLIPVFPSFFNAINGDLYAVTLY